LGSDIHALVMNRPLILGGVEIPHSKGLEGHSDADAVLHALIDAILGAMGEGDIGEHFPDTSPEFKDQSSRELLKSVLQIMKDKKFEIINTDIIISAEEPKLSPHKLKIRERIAQDLGVDVSRVNVKAKSNEGFDAIGRGEAIATQAIVLLKSAA